MSHRLDLYQVISFIWYTASVSAGARGKDERSEMSWNEKVAAALARLEKPSPKTSAEELREIIDDVVIGKSRTEIVEMHQLDPVITALARVTMAIQGKGAVWPLAEGGWYASQGKEQPYIVAPDFATAWKHARGLI
jgi:hypothetical protein